jgi:hypothetical protein
MKSFELLVIRVLFVAKKNILNIFFFLGFKKIQDFKLYSVPQNKALISESF